MAQASFGPQNLHVESFRLLSGHKIPAVGLGTWKADDEAYKSVFTAVVEVIFHHISSFMYKTDGRAIFVLF